MASKDRERWNAKHGAAGADRPPASRLLAALERDDLRRRTALDVACGRGRHALALARAGFEVLAVDISDVGLERLDLAASEAGLPIRTLQRDLSSEGLPELSFDLVVVVDYLERSLFPALRAAIAPGGAIFYQTFTAAHAEATGFPRAYCLEEGELVTAFEGFEVLAHASGELDGRHQESLLARRTS